MCISITRLSLYILLNLSSRAVWAKVTFEKSKTFLCVFSVVRQSCCLFLALCFPFFYPNTDWLIWNSRQRMGLGKTCFCYYKYGIITYFRWLTKKNGSWWIGQEITDVSEWFLEPCAQSRLLFQTTPYLNNGVSQETKKCNIHLYYSLVAYLIEPYKQIHHLVNNRNYREEF